MSTSSADAARRFAEDLKVVREARQVGLERLYEAARIPLDVLQSFERDGLADNRMFNRVYLRSLVRTYADIVGLPVPLALDALDAALDGRYDGAIRAFTEGATAGTPAPEASAPDAATLTEAPSAQPESHAPAPDADTSPEAPMPVVEEAAAEEAGDEGETVPAATETTDVAGPAPVSEALPMAASGAEALPARSARVRREMAPDPQLASGYAIPSPDPSRYAYEEARGLPAWAKVALGLLVLVLLGGGVFWWMSRDDEDAGTAPASATAPPRAAAPADTAAAPATPPAPITLPDTLHLAVNASGGPLRGIRITVDDDVRRPYWIEQGNTRTFAFRDSVAVTDPPAEATLTVEGRPVPASARRADGTVVLRRSALAAGR